MQPVNGHQFITQHTLFNKYINLANTVHTKLCESPSRKLSKLMSATFINFLLNASPGMCGAATYTGQSENLLTYS